jgi:hypothetical protein
MRTMLLTWDIDDATNNDDHDLARFSSLLSSMADSSMSSEQRTDA